MKFREYFTHAAVLGALVALLIVVFNASISRGAEPAVSVQLPVAAGDLRVSAHRMGIRFEVKGDTIVVREGKITILTIELSRPPRAAAKKGIIPLLESDDPAEQLEGLRRAEEKYGGDPLTQEEVDRKNDAALDRLREDADATSLGYRLFRRVRSRRVSFD